MKKKNGAAENIRVVIRCRHLLPFEMERGDKATVRMDLATSQVVVQHAIGDPDTFAFDAVFNNTFSQRDIFLQEVQPLVEAALQGYNTTVFAYGQSGSGKTHTMTGNLSDPKLWGMMPQVVDHLFKEITKLSSPTKSFKVRVSYVELYNGKSRDLLASKQVNLEIKQDMAKNFYVKGAENPEVTTFNEAINYFNAGTDRRQTASTDLNDHSSRSHSLFIVQIEQSDYEHDPNTPIVLTSKINVVDLAGSEKLSKTNATGDTRVEGCNINLSLSALATVIDSIVKNNKHIPYRASPLTMLLKDSLGGNSKTVMFANIGPSDKNISETISTLRFALRAKQIENKPIKNLDPKDARIQDLLDQIEDLKKRLGGDVNLEEEDGLRQRIEELEVENASLREATEKEGIEQQEADRKQQALVEEYTAIVREREAELQRVKDEFALLESNSQNDAGRIDEMRSLIVDFIRRVCTDEQIQSIRSRMPQNGDYNLGETGWDYREIQFYLEGFVQQYEEWRQSVYTQEDMHNYATKATTEMQELFQRNLDEVTRSRDELARQRQEDAMLRSADNESLSQLKVEHAALKEENTKLREKIERDQEKIKAKLQANKDERRQLTDEMDGLKAQLVEKERDIEKLKKLLEESGGRGGLNASMTSNMRLMGGRACSLPGAPLSDDTMGIVHQLQAEKTALESRVREANVSLRRYGVCLATQSEVVGSSSANASEANDAFVLAAIDEATLDNDLLGQLQQQVRMQQRLLELRHNHQRRLDDMIRKFELLKTGQVTPNTVGSIESDAVVGGISEETMNQRIMEVIQEKEQQLEQLTVERDRMCDKLVRKLNKGESRIRELEASLEEERTHAAEEKAELESEIAELQEYNQRLSVELETMRGTQSALEREAQGRDQANATEVAHLKRAIEEYAARIDQLKSKASEYDTLQAEFRRLQQHTERTEASLKEKISSLDNSRQAVKWSNSLLKEEKKKVEDMALRLQQVEMETRAREQALEAKIIERDNMMVAANNNKISELENRHRAELQELMQAENEKHRAMQKKVKSAKAQAQKAAQRYDEMILENETLLTRFEELKFNSMKAFREKQEMQRDLDSMRPAHSFSPRRF